MRRICAFLMTALALLTGVACNNDDVGGGGKEPKSLFDITIYEITAIGADVEISTTDYDGGYYFDALTEERYDYFKVVGFQKFIDNEISKRIESLGITKE